VTTGDYLRSMKVVGIKELKARLSEYVRAVKAGETVLVTERDEVVAELRPVSRRPAPREALHELLDGLAEQGELTRARLPKGSWTWRVGGLGLEAGAAMRLLDELREDR
jgi:prevent-host-death family protein